MWPIKSPRCVSSQSPRHRSAIADTSTKNGRISRSRKSNVSKADRSCRSNKPAIGRNRISRSLPTLGDADRSCRYFPFPSDVGARAWFETRARHRNGRPRAGGEQSNARIAAAARTAKRVPRSSLSPCQSQICSRERRRDRNMLPRRVLSRAHRENCGSRRRDDRQNSRRRDCRTRYRAHGRPRRPASQRGFMCSQSFIRSTKLRER